MSDYIIYTDGCSLGNPGPGGYGVVLITPDGEKELSGGFRNTTNNRMEILAAIKGISLTPEGTSTILYSDSKLLTDTINLNWLENWKKKAWRKSDNKPVLNIDLWQELDILVSKRNVKFVWVKAHSGILYNERCDLLSKQAAENPNKSSDELYEAKQSQDISLFSGNEQNPNEFIRFEELSETIRFYSKNAFVDIPKYELSKILNKLSS